MWYNNIKNELKKAFWSWFFSTFNIFWFQFNWKIKEIYEKNVLNGFKTDKKNISNDFKKSIKKQKK